MQLVNEETPAPSPRRRFRWLRREAIDLGDFVVQILAVVIGILLALFINNWVTQRQQQANVHEAMRAIRGELGQNRANARHYATRLFGMVAAMQASSSNKHQPPRPCYLWDGWGGIAGLTPLDAAYQTSIASQALANMPFKQAQLVAQVYGRQQFLVKGIDVDVSLLVHGSHPVQFCTGLIRDIGNNAAKLDALYTKLIGPDPVKMSASRH